MAITCIKVESGEELRKYPGRSKSYIAEFLHKHLEKYKDPVNQIEAALDYAFSEAEGKGGFLVLEEFDGKLIGVVVVNRTGMSGYIPENILVYLATDSSRAPLGSGFQLLKYALEQMEGDVALHVEYDNRARKIYEQIGFTSKYAEMRYHKS